MHDESLDFDERAGPGVAVEERYGVGVGRAGVDEVCAYRFGVGIREGDEAAKLGERGVEEVFLGAPVVGFEPAVCQWMC